VYKDRIVSTSDKKLSLFDYLYGVILDSRRKNLIQVLLAVSHAVPAGSREVTAVPKFISMCIVLLYFVSVT
jgi:hypothetical protein